MKRVMLSVVLAVVVLSGMVSDAAQVGLKDGSVFVGTIKNERVRLKTGFGELTPALTDLAAIEGGQVKFTDGNSIKAALSFEGDGLIVETAYGVVKLDVTPEQLDFIDFTGQMNKPRAGGEIPAGTAQISLKDKTFIIGELQNIDLTVKTKYGALRPNLADIAAITGNLVTLKDGETLKGDVDFGMERWIVKTAFGVFTLKFGAGDIEFVDFTGKLAQATKQPAEAEFFDDFDKGPKPDWKPVIGDWTMSNGMYTVLNIQDQGDYVTALENKDWTNFVLTIDVSPGATEASSSNSADRWITARICPRRTDRKNAVCFWIASKNFQFRQAGWFTIKNGQGSETVSVVEMETPSNKIVQIKIEVKNNVFTAYLDGTQLNQIYDSTFPSGSISLGQRYETWYGPKRRVAFDNLKVTPLK